MPEPYGDETLAERVRRLRTAAGLTQDGLAALAGVSPSQVVKVESGETQTLQPETAEKYSRVLALPEAYIRTGVWPEPEDAVAPPLEVYLRQNSRLSDDDVAQVAAHIRALEAQQELRRMIREAEERGSDGR